MTVSVETAQAFLDENFAEWVLALKPVVQTMDQSGATLTMEITPALARVGGIVSGQALAALADTAMVIACGGCLGEFRPVATTNLDTQFLRPGTGDRIRCEAQIVKPGRALIFLRADLYAEPSNKLIATATGTFFVV